jgi:cysteine-rich repeat protein
MCGDGVQDEGEGCDDGNTVDGDGCDAECQPSGRVLWSLEVDVRSSGDEGLTSLAVDDDGAVVGAGFTRDLSDPGVQDVVVAFVDAGGGASMTEVIDSPSGGEMSAATDGALDIAVRDDGSVVVVGFVYEGSVAEPGEHPIVVALDRSGQELWRRGAADGLGPGRARAVAVDAAGRTWVGGSQGNAAWLQAFGAGGGTTPLTYTPEISGGTCAGCDAVAALCSVPSGGVAAAAALEGPDDVDAWVALLDGQGNIAWTDVYDGGGDDEVLGIGADDGGGVVVLGASEQGSHYLLRFDAAGVLVEEVTDPLGENVRPKGFAVAPDGGYATSTKEFLSTGETVITVHRLSPDHEVLWSGSWGADEPGRSAEVLDQGVAFGPGGGVFVAGRLADERAASSNGLVVSFGP